MRPRYVLLVICFIVLAVLNNAFYLANAADQSSLPRLKSDANDAALQGLPVKVKVKIFLQGCYDTNTSQMTTLLNTGSYLPLTSPYCEDRRSVSAIPNNVTDWVLVQLHNSADSAPVVSHSAFLRHDGYIVADDGTTNILVAVPPGNYYVAVVHRNHTTVMTTSAIALSSDSSVLYDFTANAEKCYGANGLAELEPGVFGMWAGDINHDGKVTTRDYTIWFESYRVGLSGYQSSDVNQDGLVKNQDYLVWLENAQKGVTSPIRRVGDIPLICIPLDSIDFGIAYAGSSADRILTISNIGTATLSVSSMNTTNSAFSIIDITNFDIPAGANQEIKLRFSPTSSIGYSASLFIYSNSDVGVDELFLKGLASEIGTVTDIDGNVYKTVKIGDQWWMAENLKVTHYRNGDSIPHASDDSAWAGMTVGAYSNYYNNEENVNIYGRLYNWYVIEDIRNIAPIGWHVPSDDEWKILEMYLGVSPAIIDAWGGRGTDEGGKMKEIGTSHWISPNTGATNLSGFSARPGGYRTDYGHYTNLRSSAIYWSSTAPAAEVALIRRLSNDNSLIDRWHFEKPFGFSIRCIKD